LASESEPIQGMPLAREVVEAVGLKNVVSFEEAVEW
jgi:hypothetical protein